MKTCPSCLAAYTDNVGFCPHDGATLRSSSGLEPGTVIRKKYRIEGEIGRGGMGVVYRARHLLWNEDKAIKLLLNVSAEGGRPSQGILSEALVMRQLEHPSIVRVEDADFTEDDKFFVVMEYIEGENLRQRIDRGPLPWRHALAFTSEACAGLAVAHARGIIHRDIKPQNLLLAKSAAGVETVKLIDFGIAKVREEAGLGFTGVATSNTNFMGTPEYASPEQAMGMRGGDLDPRTDLYSLGLVLFEMLTGARQFEADTALASLLLRVQNDPISPGEARPDLGIPQAVSNLVLKAVSRDREARFTSALEMAESIQGILGQQSPTTPPNVVPAARPRGSKTLGALVGAGVVAAALVMWFFWPRPHYTTEPGVASPVVTTPAPVQPSKTVAGQHERRVQEQDPPPPKQAQAVEPAKAAATTITGEVKVNPKDGLKYLWIAPGKFTMGCRATTESQCEDGETPAHEVVLTKGFWIGETEVTQAAFERVTGHNPSELKGADLPVDMVAWFQANAYCKEAGLRLPTEAEWEYAAHGGGGRRNKKLGELAWFVSNSEGKVHPVAQKLSNGYGLYDTLGNVAEWVADWYGPYTDGAAIDPPGPATGEFRIIRGGSVIGGPKVVRIVARLTRKPVFRGRAVGFRCAGD